MQTVHDRLVHAGAHGWEGFTAAFTPPVVFEVPGLVSKPHRFTAKLSYRAKPFVSVPIEVSPRRPVMPTATTRSPRTR